MQLRNHIAYRFLTDDTLIHEMMEQTYPEIYYKLAKDKDADISPEDGAPLHGLYDVLRLDEQKAFYITDTVLDKLDLLKISKKNDMYDWTVFKEVQDCRLTFILRNNILLRIRFTGDMICFCHLEYQYYSKEDKEKHKVPGNAYWINYFVNRNTGEQCDHFNHIDVKGNVERFTYHLLCFFYLSENTERIVSPGKSYGTKKQPDALSNDLNIPVTIINSCWNITSIRTEGFGVRGHFRLQPYGPGMNQVKMIFIEPFEKHGYVRKATKPE